MKRPTFPAILAFGIALAALGAVRLQTASVHEQKASAKTADCGEKPAFLPRASQRVTERDPAAGVGMCFE